ncbi:helix-turn-helix transcriptional regulator [Intrasporangium sp. YIM S08009]|uniref:helix-turn-helix transcriptional regulator n=1 Tax=Intrasporangium zincisolvens TaxID=3080018 RepID=UPI002B054C2E|nr:helix-turn-helix transcriptional regulator [Intrasporangium sp. YIM S08009]
MGVVDELLRARAEFERGDWRAAYDAWAAFDLAGLSAQDLERSAAAAHLLGRVDDAVERYTAAYEARVAAGEHAEAAVCAFHVSMALRTTGGRSAVSAWLARGERHVADLPEEAAARGWITFSRMFTHLGAGRIDDALACARSATDIGRRSGDADLLATGLCAQGRMSIYGGHVPDGVGLLDESMLEAERGAREPITVGHVYCTAIEGCQEVSDLVRVAEWTARLTTWCAAQPGLVLFTGQSALHRAQVMRARGAWDEALDELDLAVARYSEAGAVDAVGQASCERGDLLRLRGDLAGADVAYARGSEHGYEPQPGLALLAAARGQGAAAAATARRLLAEPGPSVTRSRLLPGVVEVLAAAGDVEAARAAAVELEHVADAFGSEALEAGSALAWGRVQLASQDAAGALPYLRRARQGAVALDLPYETALAEVATGRALIALGDHDAAHRALAAARVVLDRLGARPAVGEIDAMTGRRSLPAGLSAREVQVLRLVAAGRSNADIAAELVLSDRTVARHLSNIFGKLGVGSRTAAAAFAFERGLAGGSGDALGG